MICWPSTGVMLPRTQILHFFGSSSAPFSPPFAFFFFFRAEQSLSSEVFFPVARSMQDAVCLRTMRRRQEYQIVSCSMISSAMVEGSFQPVLKPQVYYNSHYRSRKVELKR